MSPSVVPGWTTNLFAQDSPYNQPIGSTSWLWCHWQCTMQTFLKFVLLLKHALLENKITGKGSRANVKGKWNGPNVTLTDAVPGNQTLLRHHHHHHHERTWLHHSILDHECSVHQWTLKLKRSELMDSVCQTFYQHSPPVALLLHFWQQSSLKNVWWTQNCCVKLHLLQGLKSSVVKLKCARYVVYILLPKYLYYSMISLVLTLNSEVTEGRCCIATR